MKKPISYFKFLTLGCISIFTTSLFAQDFYKWTDAQGSTHYTNTPPPKAKGISQKGKVQTYGWNNNGSQKTTSVAPVEAQTSNFSHPPVTTAESHASSEPSSRSKEQVR